MATRAQAEELLGQGHSHETAARELGISPGLAQLIATGRPGEFEVPAYNPTSSVTVLERARRELQRP